MQKISDEELLRLCKQFGQRALLWRRKFIGLLPEVNRRGLYKKKGCTSIFEFAAKLAGISEEQVRVVLRLEKRFEKTPILQNLLVAGEVSVHKLARVVSIATPDNEESLAAQVKKLPKMALETLVRDEKNLPGQTFTLSAEVQKELDLLHQQGQDVNAILLKLLKDRKQKIQEEKEELAENTQPTSSRYIPVKVRRILKEEFGKKCSIATCQRPSEEIHHTTHNPHYLAPLCKGHHQLAHLADLNYRMARGPS
jgi:hypothetical protein